ncbi:hypothetical protein QUF74_13980 [Candidatus Halobeggiatoa sp. HSG11]|nr:hypothetical protein [Candidatus Halobeggiatoa sp. HSG11]
MNKLYKYWFILLWLPMNISAAVLCSDLKSLQTHKDQDNYRDALQLMGNCLTKISPQPSTDDLLALDEIIGQVLLLDDALSFEDSYRNFQSVIENYYHLQGLEFKFADYFQRPKSKLFSKLYKPEEKYYFYYDTGRMLSFSRGIALTNKAVIWKNITDEAQRMDFSKINTIALIYERGLSLTGWKLRLDKYKDIRLSGVPKEAITTLAQAIIYFINVNRTGTKPIKLLIPEKEQAILAGWITLCKHHQENKSPITELQLLDACITKFTSDCSGLKVSKQDNALLKQLVTKIFSQPSNKVDGYRNFKIMLSTHIFRDFGFQFIGSNLKTDTELFKSVRDKDESYKFYFDTGYVIPNVRGIALTDKAIIWKNLLAKSIDWKNMTGSTKRLAFDEIFEVKLISERDFKSITSWKIRVNGTEDITLYSLTDKNTAELFASAIVYFINISVGKNLKLQIK